MLPKDIFILDGAFVEDTFDARFDCVSRSYKYYFINRVMDIEKMNQVCDILVGQHDFRNFCKLNVPQVINYRRNIQTLNIEYINDREYCLNITANAFLWHMVRYIVATLFRVGQGWDSISDIEQLLDIIKTPSKPGYGPEKPDTLVLSKCNFNRKLFHDSTCENVRLQIQSRVDAQQEQLLISRNILCDVGGDIDNKIAMKKGIFEFSVGKSLEESIKDLKGKDLEIYHKKQELKKLSVWHSSLTK